MENKQSIHTARRPYIHSSSVGQTAFSSLVSFVMKESSLHFGLEVIVHVACVFSSLVDVMCCGLKGQADQNQKLRAVFAIMLFAFAVARVLLCVNRSLCERHIQPRERVPNA